MDAPENVAVDALTPFQPRFGNFSKDFQGLVPHDFRQPQRATVSADVLACLRLQHAGSHQASLPSALRSLQALSVSEHCKIVDAYKDISHEGDENMTTDVASNALALPAGAPKEENADAEGASPEAPPVEAGALAAAPTPAPNAGVVLCAP